MIVVCVKSGHNDPRTWYLAKRIIGEWANDHAPKYTDGFEHDLAGSIQSYTDTAHLHAHFCLLRFKVEKMHRVEEVLLHCLVSHTPSN